MVLVGEGLNLTPSKESKELLRWLVTAIAVSGAIVFGHALDNLGQVPAGELVRPFLFLSIVSSLLVAVTFITARPFVGLVPAGIYILFTFLFFNQLLFGYPYSGYLSLAVLVCLALLVQLSLHRLGGRIGAQSSLVIATVMAVAPVVLVLASSEFSYEAPPIASEFAHEASIAVASTKTMTEHLPDIIYVVPDRYPSSKTLLKEYQFDNGEFYTQLRQRGFLVVEDAVANYPKTFLSLASTHNAGYLDEFSRVFEGKSVDRTPVFKAMKNNLAQQLLRNFGYRFINFGNQWGPTRHNINADENFQGYAANNLAGYLTEFESTLLVKTPIPLLPK